MVLLWETVDSEVPPDMEKIFYALIFRAKVPGGWFVSIGEGTEVGAFFYPDPEHKWDGSSLT